MTVKRKRLLLVGFFALILLLNYELPPVPVAAGPLQNFYESPIPYWDDDSTDTSIDWNAGDQTIDIGWANTSDYEEDFDDVAGWACDYATPNLGGYPGGKGTEYDWASEGDALHMWINFDEAVDGEYLRYKATVSIPLDGSEIVEVRYKTEVAAGVVIRLRLYIDGVEKTVSGMEGMQSTYWNLATCEIDDYVAGGGTLTELRLYFDDQPNSYAGGNTSFWISDVRIYDYANVNVGVPIERSSSQELTVSLDPSNLTTMVRFQLYSNQTASGQYADVNSTMVRFRDGSTGTITGNVTLAFHVMDDWARYWITAYDENGGIAFWNCFYGLGGNDWFRMTCGSFTENFTLFYIEGDTRYVDIINRPEFSVSGTQDSDVMQSLYSLYWESASGGNIDHDYVATATFPGMQYLRTEWATVIDVGSYSGNPVLHQNLTIEVEDLVVFYEIAPQYIAATVGYINVTCYVYNSTDLTYDFYVFRQHTLGPLDSTVCMAKTMFWRTQEDNLGIMLWGRAQDDDANLWTGGWPDITDLDFGEVAGENETLWVSNYTITDWDCDVSFGYHVEYVQAAGDVLLNFAFNYLEYSYWQLSGVAQPHFSSVWWSDRPGSVIGHQWATHVGVAADDYDPPTDSDADLAYTRPWWLQATDAIGAAIGGIGDFFIGLGPSIGDFLTGALLAIPMLGAAMVSGIIDLFAPGAGSGVFTSLLDLGGGFADMLGLVPFILQIFGMVIGHVLYWVTWFQTNILTTDGLLMIGLALVAVPGFIAWQKGPEAAFDFLKTYYWGALIAILGLVYNLFMGVMNLIAGFLPGT